jgi:hypothetical protein
MLVVGEDPNSFFAILPFAVESKKTINTVIKADSLTQTLNQNPLTGGEIDAGPHSSVHVCTRLPVLIWLESHDDFRYIKFFVPEFDGQNNGTASSPIVIALRAVSPHLYPNNTVALRWLLHSPIQQKPSKSKAQLPSLF